MGKVPKGMEKLPKIPIVWVGCTNVTDDRPQTDKQTYLRRHVGNVNSRSHSLKTC